MLVVITKPNPYYAPNTWFECFDDGCRKVQVANENNRVKVVKEEGVLLPYSFIEPFSTKIGRR